ncbi:MAG: hypothetical protein K6G73_12850 [Marinilabiliaceae bacterium]|nr:hypothetical protein [Marinilabiliaceae bacterium]
MSYTREQLKRWFKNGCKPTENHFAAAFDSFWHKDDSIPASSIENFEEILAALGGLTRAEVEAMIEEHNSDSASHNLGTMDDFVAQFPD